jgi:hypothetical protein
LEDILEEVELVVSVLNVVFAWLDMCFGIRCLVGSQKESKAGIYRQRSSPNLTVAIVKLWQGLVDWTLAGQQVPYK